MDDCNEDTRELELWLINDEGMYNLLECARNAQGLEEIYKEVVGDCLPDGQPLGNIDWDYLYNEHCE